MKKAFLISIFFIFLLFLTACSIDVEDIDDFDQEEDETPIGGDRDEYGCLGSAGYTRNNTLGVCIREWEFEDIDQRNAIGIASDYLKNDINISTYGLAVAGINITQCQGCYPVYDVNFIREDEEFSIRVDDWVAIELIIKLS